MFFQGLPFYLLVLPNSHIQFSKNFIFFKSNDLSQSSFFLFFHNSFRRFSIEPKNYKKNGNHTFSRMVAKFAFYCKIR